MQVKSMQQGVNLKNKTRSFLYGILLFLILSPISTLASDAPIGWQANIVSLVSHQRYKEAGEQLKAYCVVDKSSDLCLLMASAYYEGEAKFGIQSREIVEAYKYTKLACEYGSSQGCDAAKAAIEKGELLQNVLFEPGVLNRDAQLKEAIQFGADLNSTTLFTATVLQVAINEEKTEAVKLLVSNGADVNYRVSDEDLTPLMYAVNSGNKEIVTLLLDKGADKSQTMKAPDYLKMDKESVDVCDLANKLENTEMVELLKCN